MPVIDLKTGLDGFALTRSGDQSAPIADDSLIIRADNLDLHPYADWDGNSYSNTSGLSKGLLLEQGATQHADQFDTWTTTRTQRFELASGVTGPVAGQPVWELQWDDGVSDQSITGLGPRNDIDTPNVPNGNYRFSIWVRYVSGPTNNNFRLRIFSGNGGAIYTNNIQAPSTWARYEVAAYVEGNPKGNIGVFHNTAWSGDHVMQVHAPLWELDTGLPPSSYIPPSGSNFVSRGETTVTQDLVTLGSDSFSNDFQATFVTLPQFDSNYASLVEIIAFGDSTDGLRVTVTSGTFTLHKYVDGVEETITVVHSFSVDDTLTIVVDMVLHDAAYLTVNGTSSSTVNATSLLNAGASTVTIGAGPQIAQSLTLPDSHVDPTGELANVDFNNHSVGTYTTTLLGQDFPGTTGGAGLDSNRGQINAGGELDVLAEAGTEGQAYGVWWYSPLLDGGADEVTVSYDLTLNADFDPVINGKLPGLSGRYSPSGGNRADGTNGFSSRLQFYHKNTNVGIGAYVYHMDTPTEYGEGFDFYPEFVRGTTYRLGLTVKMNTPGQVDGWVKGYVDGAEVMASPNLRFRTAADIRIDLFYFCYFFGGSSAEHAPSKDEHIQVDNIAIRTGSAYIDTPEDIIGLMSWVQAKDDVNCVAHSAGKVTSITSLAANVRDGWTNPDAESLKYGNRTLNGRSVLEHNETLPGQVSQPGAQTDITAPYTAVWFIQASSALPVSYRYAFSPWNTGSQGMALGHNSSGKITYRAGSLIETSLDFPIANPAVLFVHMPAGGVGSYVEMVEIIDGVAQASVTSTPTDTDGFPIQVTYFGHSSSGTNLNIMEYMEYDKTLDSNDKTDLVNFVIDEWYDLDINNPEDLGDLMTWVQAKDPACVTESGGEISELASKSVSDTLLPWTLTSGTPLGIGNHLYNGHNTIELSASSPGSLRQADVSPAVNAPYTGVVFVQARAGGTFVGYRYVYAPINTGASGWSVGHNSPLNITYRAGSLIETSVPFPMTNPAVIFVVLQGSGSDSYIEVIEVIDNVPQAPVKSAVTDQASLPILSTAFGHSDSQGTDVNVMEMLTYDRELSPADRISLAKWIADDWAGVPPPEPPNPATLTGEREVTATHTTFTVEVTSDIAGQVIYFAARTSAPYTSADGDLIKVDPLAAFKENKPSVVGPQTFSVTGAVPGTTYYIGFSQDND